MNKPKIGAHVSTAGGVSSAFKRAEEISAECIQIFGASPRAWQVKFPDKDEIELFKKEERRSGIGPVYLHASYLLNLGSPKRNLVAISVKNLAAHLKIAEMLGASGLIFHIGSSAGMDKAKSIEQVISAMKEVLKEAPGKSFLVMENAAGGGEKIGKNADELAHIAGKVGSPRVKVCLDTAHAFESGLIKEFSAAEIKRLVDEWNKKIGLTNVVAIHANDSKTPWNSHNDRHENIGKGYIGLPGFKELAKEKRLWDKAWFLEVPGFDDNGPDKKNVDILKSCFK